MSARKNELMEAMIGIGAGKETDKTEKKEPRKMTKTEKYRKFQTSISIPPDVKENGIILAQIKKTSFTQFIIDLIEKESFLNKDKIKKFKELTE